DDRFTARQLQQRAQVLRVDELSGWVVRAAYIYYFHAIQLVGNTLHIKLPVGKRGDSATFNADGFGTDAVHAVGWWAEKYRVFTRFAEGANEEFDAFICTTTYQHLL